MVRLLLYAYGPIAQFAPAVAATLYLERVRGPAVLSGLVAGSVVATACVVWPDARPFPLHAGIYGLPANLLVLAIVSVLDSRPASKAERNFLGHASGALGADPPSS